MICFSIGGADGQCRVDRLPSNRELRPLCRTEIAEVFISLLVIQFQTIEATHIPNGTGHRKTNLPIGGPNIAAALGRREVSRANGLVGRSQRIRPIAGVLGPMFTADGERDWACWKGK